MYLKITCTSTYTHVCTFTGTMYMYMYMYKCTTRHIYVHVHDYNILCFAHTHFAVEMKPVSSPEFLSSCSSVLASPVDCRPITTHFPSIKAFFANLMTSGTLAAMHMYLKNRWWEAQNWPHIVFSCCLSKPINSDASLNWRWDSFHYISVQIYNVMYNIIIENCKH